MKSKTLAATTLALAVALVQLGCSGSPAAPTTTPVPTVPGSSVALASIALSSPTVVGGESVTGTVALTGPAPTGGAEVVLTGTDPLLVPAAVTVAAGSASAQFTVSTRVVSGAMNGTVSGSYAGATASAKLTVNVPNIAIARFGVTGPHETDTCTMADNGATLNCTFNGSTSTAPGTIVAWEWTFTAAAAFTQTTTGPILAMPKTTCSLLPAPPLPPGSQGVPLVVTLKVRDDQGNVSAVAANQSARIIPTGSCGF